MTRFLSYAVLLIAVVVGLCVISSRKDTVDVASSTAAPSTLTSSSSLHDSFVTRMSHIPMQRAAMASIPDTESCSEDIRIGPIDNASPRSAATNAIHASEAAPHHDLHKAATPPMVRDRSRLQDWLTNSVRQNPESMHRHVHLHAYLLRAHPVATETVFASHPAMHTAAAAATPGEEQEKSTHGVEQREPRRGRYVILSMEDDDAHGLGEVTVDPASYHGHTEAHQRRERGRWGLLRRRRAVLHSLYHFNFTRPQEVHVIDDHHVLVYLYAGSHEQTYLHTLRHAHDVRDNSTDAGRRLSSHMSSRHTHVQGSTSLAAAAMTLQSSTWRVMDVYASADAAPHKMSQKLLPLLFLFLDTNETLVKDTKKDMCTRSRTRPANVTDACESDTLDCPSRSAASTTVRVDVTLWTAQGEAERVANDVERMLEQLNQTSLLDQYLDGNNNTSSNRTYHQAEKGVGYA